MKISKTKIILVSAIVLALILIAANYFFFISIKNINTQASVISNEVDAYKKEQDRLAGKIGIEEIQSLIGKVNSYYVDKDGVVSFIESIENEARSRGIVLITRSVDTENFGGATDDESKNATKEILRLKLEARGSWMDTMNFISFLENLPYKVTLVNVDFSKMPSGDVISSSGDYLIGPPKGSKIKAPSASDWSVKIELTVLKQK